MAKAAPKKRQHYVDNKEFLAAIIKYKEKVEHAKENELPTTIQCRYQPNRS